MSGDGPQSALADGLRSLGQLLDSPQRRGTVKTAVSSLIEAVSAADGQLKNKDTQGAVKGGVGLLIEGIGLHLSAGNGNGELPALDDLPLRIGR